MDKHEYKSIFEAVKTHTGKEGGRVPWRCPARRKKKRTTTTGKIKKIKQLSPGQQVRVKLNGKKSLKG